MSFAEIWQFVVEKPAVATVVLAALTAVVGSAWKIYTHLSKKGESPANRGQSVRDRRENIQIGQARNVSIQRGAQVDVNAIVDKLTAMASAKGALEKELEATREELSNLRRQQLVEAVEALDAQRDEPDAPPGIDNALQLLTKGETEAAEQVFQTVKTRRKAEGTEAFKEAAAAARHIGALAFLHDTQKALAAYREAVELDPDNASGWNSLGQVLYRIGDLDGAMSACERVLSLGNVAADQKLVAVATGNLGVIYQTRGNLDRAEEMSRKSLELSESLGRGEGMANQYGNLGVIYRKRGELDLAEDMHQKSLEIDMALGHKEGMAIEYGNLGLICQARGELDRAEQMLRTSLRLNEDLGHEEGMASQYGNLGLIYRRRGKLDRAEDLIKKSLELHKDLGNKEGTAHDYANLGTLYTDRGNLNRAEELYLKALALFTEIGAKPEIDQVEYLLADLRQKK